MLCHGVDRVGCVAARTGYASVVEEYDWPICRQSIGHRRIPMIQPTSKVLHEDQRSAGLLSEFSVSKRNSVCFEGLSACRHMCLGHEHTSGSAGSHQGRRSLPSRYSSQGRRSTSEFLLDRGFFGYRTPEFVPIREGTFKCSAFR